MNNIKTDKYLDKIKQELLIQLRNSCKTIAPVWPLENFVAVNPFLGHSNKSFSKTAFELGATGGIQMTMPVSFYMEKIGEGIIDKNDISELLSKSKIYETTEDFINSINLENKTEEVGQVIATVSEIALEITGKDWTRFFISRISFWAASYFDNGQAIWSTSLQNEEPFLAWKREAAIDFTPEIAGLKNFRKLVENLPENHLEAIQVALEKLGIPFEGREIYFNSLLLKLGGWSAHAARLDWESELYGYKDGKLIEFLGILISWELCLFESLNNSKIESHWLLAKERLKYDFLKNSGNIKLSRNLILQEAFELALQRELVNQLNNKGIGQITKTEISAQAIFCIDVRSEVYRRNLEIVDDSIVTMGFAGFFAFPIKYIPVAHEEGEAQCPVLLKTGPTIFENLPDQNDYLKAYNSRLFNKQMQKVWKSFRSGAVTCFSFVSPLGLYFLPKLFTDSFGYTRPVPHPNSSGISKKLNSLKGISLNNELSNHETVGILIEQQIQMAKDTLNAMSLSDNFATFVLIVGHGSTTVNNPHATGYDCGACGGHTGEANAKVVAAVLNSVEVRIGLQSENIYIPMDTVFLACLHDTTTDHVAIYNEYDVPDKLEKDLLRLKSSLALAGKASRLERSIRLNEAYKGDIHKNIIQRSKDWSQVRPEWGLAGCTSFIVANRERTKSIDLKGKSFLHSYDWKKDANFAVLELIMTAPMVVTTWINLQYYGSTVDNRKFGSGNKTLHNITAGIGVLEGYSGDLRVGLPYQSIHDGHKYQHEPAKLNVIIEAPIKAMNAILQKHTAVRNLCDNGWMHLMNMNDNGKVTHKYKAGFEWEQLESVAQLGNQIAM
jgi:uncharacterized protein YbcC (UPF0753/DUF2309 family)